MRDEETIVLLREIRDLLVAQRELMKAHEEKYQKYLDTSRQDNKKFLDASRQDYLDHIKQTVWSNWKNTLYTYFVLFFVLAFGVFVGVLVGVRMATPWLNF